MSPDAERLAEQLRRVLSRTPVGRNELRQPQSGLSLPQRWLLANLDGDASLQDLTALPGSPPATRLPRDAAKLVSLGLALDVGEPGETLSSFAPSTFYGEVTLPLPIDVVQPGGSTIERARLRAEAAQQDAPPVPEAPTWAPVAEAPSAVQADPPTAHEHEPSVFAQVVETQWMHEAEVAGGDRQDEATTPARWPLALGAVLLAGAAAALWWWTSNAAPAPMGAAPPTAAEPPASAQGAGSAAAGALPGATQAAPAAPAARSPSPPANGEGRRAASSAADAVSLTTAPVVAPAVATAATPQSRAAAAALVGPAGLRLATDQRPPGVSGAAAVSPSQSPSTVATQAPRPPVGSAPAVVVPTVAAPVSSPAPTSATAPPVPVPAAAPPQPQPAAQLPAPPAPSVVVSTTPAAPVAAGPTLAPPPVNVVEPRFPRDGMGLGGRAVVLQARLSVSPSGAVTNVVFGTGDVGSRTFERAARAALLQWRFPEGTGERYFVQQVRFSED